MKSHDRQQMKEIIRKFVKRIDVYQDRIEVDFNAVYFIAKKPMDILPLVHVKRVGTELVSGF